MGWRCIKDIFNYCKGEPEWEEEPTQHEDELGGTPSFTGGTCKLEPETCGRCIKHSELTGQKEEAVAEKR